jgi:perosamine synthetase
MVRRIPVAEPVLGGNEKKYVLDCLDSSWVSGVGRYLDAFEREFAGFCNVEHAVAVTNGTAGLHVALVALDIRAGDEVLVPDLTYIASANAVTYCGAKPVFVDVDPATWTMDLNDCRRKLTPATRAIMPVHLYGHPADMDPLNEFAREHGLHVIEDAAEAHGALYKARPVGSLGTLAVFSFFGNKIVTTGEGGMVTTSDPVLARRIRLLKGQGMDPTRRYWFPIVGYNYRMTNIQAAIGLAQLERVDWFIERRREVAQWYREDLRGAPLEFPPEAEWARNVYWMFSVCVPEGTDRDRVAEEMEGEGIETRPFFYPMHSLPPYQNGDGDEDFPVSSCLARRGLNLPSSATLSRDDVRFVSNGLLAALDEVASPEETVDRIAFRAR